MSCACPTATRAVIDRAVASGSLHSSHLRRIGALTTSSIGFGAYRVGSSAHFEAMQAALSSGVINLVETSTHYGTRYPGESEEMIGACLRALENSGRRKRDEIVVVTKIGHITVPREHLEQGTSDDYEKTLGYKNIVRDRSAGSTQNTKQRHTAAGAVGDMQVEERTQGSDDIDNALQQINTASLTPLQKTWHCLEPDFILDEYAASKMRLGTAPDILFLHNPEFFLSQALIAGVPLGEAWREMEQRLETAFATLEALKAAGEIAGFGVSGNFLSCYHSVSGRPNSYEALSLQSCLGAAVDAMARCYSSCFW
ncbi:unnamed protein product [Amoebophrya sp. A25]|nr:unnamed protein product [Amoebophrya sp. A25]|eukprot:GSA25T00015762001.1